MTMEEEREQLAAEYVLGTLDTDERALADARLQIDQGFAEVVARWERRLGELNVLVAPVEPQPAVWESIRAKLPETAPSESVRLPDVGGPAVAAASVASAGSGAEVIALHQRVRRWRGLTVIAGALAACFVGLVLAREYRPDLLPSQWRHKPEIVEREIVRTVEKPVEVVREVIREVQVPAPQQTQFVAVFTDRQERPAFVMTVDLEKRTLTVRREAAEEKENRVYQLWIKTDAQTLPQSLGILEPNESKVQETLRRFDPAVIQNATFGISNEPMGGSPQPAADAIHARLVTPPATP